MAAEEDELLGIGADVDELLLVTDDELELLLLLRLSGDEVTTEEVGDSVGAVGTALIGLDDTDVAKTAGELNGDVLADEAEEVGEAMGGPVGDEAATALSLDWVLVAVTEYDTSAVALDGLDVADMPVCPAAADSSAARHEANNSHNNGIPRKQAIGLKDDGMVEEATSWAARRTDQVVRNRYSEAN